MRYARGRSPNTRKYSKLNISMSLLLMSRMGHIHWSSCLSDNLILCALLMRNNPEILDARAEEKRQISILLQCRQTRSSRDSETCLWHLHNNSSSFLVFLACAWVWFSLKKNHQNPFSLKKTIKTHFFSKNNFYSSGCFLRIRNETKSWIISLMTIFYFLK